MSIWDRLSNPEDALHERKPEGGDFKEPICAFANSVPEGKDGVLFIGVADDGALIGCQNVDSLQKQIARMCEQDFYPPIAARLESTEIEGKKIIAVIVPHSRNGPHFAGHAYRRNGPQSVKADEPAYTDFFVKRTSVGAMLLEYRGGPMVRIRTFGKKLGNPALLAPNFSEHPQCMIKGVDSHNVALELVNSQRVYEAIENFSVSRDPSTGEVIFLVRAPPR